MREFDWGARGRPEVVHDRLLTAPNLITAVRLAGLPLFVWLMLEQRAYGKAFGVLVLVAATDWVDGYVARRFDQVSALGKRLDPLVDRVLIATVGLTLWLGLGWLPWFVVAAILVRDVALLAGTLVLFGTVPPIAVTRTGKVATATLLYALPSFILAHMDWAGANPFRVVGWVLSVGGITAYYVAAVQYGRAALALRRNAGAHR